ncbi:Rpn family recombination-promoting nuclease/putative transposase [Paenibacillus sp. HB172176]|uniref:Rpn family recombination-promoting nuclease/putative transposase n=1 Tax=Paenibacillus sp. HB172176 TaxID=2493690 RepID=UPI001439D66E|nr:Rpn family recombination-promoting nuclease/putative transposase [Paenibacillus sp. HB172176]
MEAGTLKSANQKQRMKPKNDFIFQKLFGEEESKESLISLLNAILGLEGEKRIRNLKVKGNKQLAKKMVDDKTGRLDISAESDDQVQYDIEMQLTDQRNMARRSLFYLSKMYIGSVKPGDDYSQLRRTVTINLLDFQLFKEREAFHTTFHLYDDRDKSLLLTDAFEVHFLELPKFERMMKDINNPLHRWLMYLDERLSEHQLKELIEMDANIKKTEELLLRLSSDEETYRLYEAREHSLMERNSLIADGVAKGIEKGKQEVIKNMLKEGVDVELIAKVTGLSIEEIRKTRDMQEET